MCGIAGYVTLKASSASNRVIRDMTDAIQHRGPDGSGYYEDAFAALGHRRLSIIDLSTGGQPMFNEDHSLCIIYNGEVFNHADLRPGLESAGHRYASKSDTETILHAYEEFGPDCVKRFRGMFAFAIWNESARSLFCARDRLGIKPFYYYWNGDLFAFASEIKALLRHPAVSPAFEESVLPEYLATGFSSSERTMFRGIRKLMPGHRLMLDADGLRIDRYWDVPGAGEPEDRDDASWIAECRKRLEETVRMRLMSDVPLGMFLSGGVDSSAIAALMSRMVSGRVKTFSVGYREAAFSELSYAAEVAKTIGTDHREVVIGMEEFFSILPRLIWHEDEPIVWPSSVSLYFVSRLAASDVKVVLTGEGADELFGGYERYAFYLKHQPWMERYARIPAGIRGQVRSSLDSSPLLGPSIRRKLQHTMLGREDTLESFYLDNFYGAFSANERLRLLGDDDAAYSEFLRYWNRSKVGGPLERLLYADQKTYLVELLMKQDQMSMANSIESRVPFLDHPFVEFAARVPDKLKIKGSTGKYILKRAVEDLLPASIVHRKKMGFPTPLRQWLGSPEAGPLLASLRKPDGFIAQYLDRQEVNRLLDRHLSGLIDGTDRIWRLINLEIWGQTFLSGRSAAVSLNEDTVDKV